MTLIVILITKAVFVLPDRGLQRFKDNREFHNPVKSFQDNIFTFLE